MNRYMLDALVYVDAPTLDAAIETFSQMSWEQNAVETGIEIDRVNRVVVYLHEEFLDGVDMGIVTDDDCLADANDENGVDTVYHNKIEEYEKQTKNNEPEKKDEQGNKVIKDIEDIWKCRACGANMRKHGLTTYQMGHIRRDVKLKVNDDGTIETSYEMFDDYQNNWLCNGINCKACQKGLGFVQGWAIGELIDDPLYGISFQRLYEDDVLENSQFRCDRCSGIFQEGGDHQSINKLCANCADVHESKSRD